MAKRRKAARQEATREADDGVKMPSESKFRSLMRGIKSAEADKNESVGRIGSLISNACERDNVDKKALSILRALDRQSLQKGATTWAHLQRYVAMYGLIDKWAQQEVMQFEPESESDYPPEPAAKAKAGKAEPMPGDVGPMLGESTH